MREIIGAAFCARQTSRGRIWGEGFSAEHGDLGHERQGRSVIGARPTSAGSTGASLMPSCARV